MADFASDEPLQDIFDSWNSMSQFAWDVTDQDDSFANYQLNNAGSLLDPFQAMHIDPNYSFDISFLPAQHEDSFVNDAFCFEVLNDNFANDNFANDNLANDNTLLPPLTTPHQPTSTDLAAQPTTLTTLATILPSNTVSTPPNPL